MATFGEILYTLRQMSHDPNRQKRPLSQARLGELIGHEMRDRGVSGAAISDWERGKSKISAEDRNVLLSLIKVLYKCGGVKTQEDANELLEAGNYRALNKEESQKIFGEIPTVSTIEEPSSEPLSSDAYFLSLIKNLFSLSEDKFRNLFAEAQEGPSPSWPRVLAALMRLTSRQFSISLRTVIWIWVWLLAWWLIAPSLQFPFSNRESAIQAMGMYVAGTLIIPPLIGLLIDTKNNEYWLKQSSVNPWLLRLYTYQGAGIGFNLGYFFVFPLVLIRYYLGLGPSVWLAFAAVTAGLILGNMSARVVPHNLWLAYGRLELGDGWIFFVVALVGPFWGIFFLKYYPVLLTPALGSMVILLALTGVVIFGIYQSRKRV